eukprot:m.304989 g.304989  ORF g.304989 m.304989 type:complete len:479 (-) comp16443_c7_seq15:834-2270(-)
MTANIIALVAMVVFVAPTRISATNNTNIVFILVDDLGEAGIMNNNPYVKGPRVQELVDNGILMTRAYVYKFCSPTRGSMLSGRYPFRLGNTRSNFIPWSRADGLNLDFDTIPLRLQKAGYLTYHVGKWHLGFHNSSLLPVNRGYDSFFGYLTGMEDHFTSRLEGMLPGCGPQTVDLTANATPAFGLNGTYTGWLYNQKAREAISQASVLNQPFFLNYWLHNTHAPNEVPDIYSNLYNFSDQGTNIMYGMISVVDEAVGNITDTLKNLNLWEDTFVIYTHDNGAPLGGGGSNYPLRGGKNSNMEGGVRVPSILSGGALSSSKRGTKFSSYFHICDWLPTLLHAVVFKGPLPEGTLTDKVSDTIPYDGVDQWDHLMGINMTAPRDEIILDHCFMPYDGTGCNHFGGINLTTGGGALIMGDMKLIVGPAGGEWTNYTNGTKSQSFGGVCCATTCLFNITADPSERTDLRGCLTNNQPSCSN